MNQHDDDQPKEPNEVEPWQPTFGTKTKVIAWIIIIAMLAIMAVVFIGVVLSF